jgi:hypothetical protein
MYYSDSASRGDVLTASHRSCRPRSPYRYRGQRSPEAIAAFVKGLLAEPVLTVNNDDEVTGHVNRHRRAIIGHFSTDTHANMEQCVTPLPSPAHVTTF